MCDTYVTSRNMMESHMSGREHLRRMKPMRKYKCDICRVDVSSQETLEAHLKVGKRIFLIYLIYFI